MKKILFLTVFTFLFTFSYTQKAPIKWGKISEKEKSFTKCLFDSSANAVVLCDYGTISYAYGQKIIFKRHTRIKILNKHAFNLANTDIIYYSKDNYNHISKINAQTININNDNSYEVNVINKNEFYTTKIDNELSKISFAFPQVKEGSIIEFSYTYLTENFFNIGNWEFQREIPVLHSEIRASINELLEYNVFYQGNRLTKKYSSKPTNSWVLEDLPAVKEEPFNAFPGDYIEKINFQLSGYNQRKGTIINEEIEYVYFMANPQKIAEEFRKIPSVESFLFHTVKAKKKLEEIGINDEMSDETKLNNIHNYIVKNYEWNGKYRIPPDNDFGKFIENKSGNGASINYLLHMLLDKAGINSNLFYISTNDNGLINENSSNVRQFNHLINLSYINGKQVFTDASCAVCPPGELPPNNLNVKGLDNRGSWVPIPIKKNNTQKSLSTIKIKDYIVIYKNENSYSGINAQVERKLIYKSGEIDYFETIVNPNSSILESDSFKVQNLHNSSQKLLTSAYYSDKEFYNNSEYINIDAVPFDELRKKMFVSNTRELPIDFIYPEEKNYYINITIPDGYEIIGKPEQTKIILPENSASFLYKLTTLGKITQIQIKFRMNRTFYSVNEYSDIKRFFELINEKCSEKIVLKKTE